MARRVKTIVVITDDLTGEELPEGQGETITFSWKGQEYEIDLSKQNSDKFRELLDPYVVAGRKASKQPRNQIRRRTKAEMRTVRQWGRENGYTVPEGAGRTPDEVIRAYDEAHRRL